MAEPNTYLLNHRIDILHDVSDGTTKPEWVSLLEKPIFAAKQGLLEKLYYGTPETKSDDSSTFIIRYSSRLSSTIRATMRIVDGGDTDHPYDIVGTPVDIFDNRRWMKIHVRRIDTNGS